MTCAWRLIGTVNTVPKLCQSPQGAAAAKVPTGCCCLAFHSYRIRTVSSWSLIPRTGKLPPRQPPFHDKVGSPRPPWFGRLPTKTMSDPSRSGRIIVINSPVEGQGRIANRFSPSRFCLAGATRFWAGHARPVFLRPFHAGSRRSLLRLPIKSILAIWRWDSLRSRW